MGWKNEKFFRLDTRKELT